LSQRLLTMHASGASAKTAAPPPAPPPKAVSEPQTDAPDLPSQTPSRRARSHATAVMGLSRRLLTLHAGATSSDRRVPETQSIEKAGEEPPDDPSPAAVVVDLVPPLRRSRSAPVVESPWNSSVTILHPRMGARLDAPA